MTYRVKNTQATLLSQYIRPPAVSVWTAVCEITVGVYSEDVPVQPIENVFNSMWPSFLKDVRCYNCYRRAFNMKCVH